MSLSNKVFSTVIQTTYKVIECKLGSIAIVLHPFIKPLIDNYSKKISDFVEGKTNNIFLMNDILCEKAITQEQRQYLTLLLYASRLGLKHIIFNYKHLNDAEKYNELYDIAKMNSEEVNTICLNFCSDFQFNNYEERKFCEEKLPIVLQQLIQKLLHEMLHNQDFLNYVIQRLIEDTVKSRNDLEKIRKDVLDFNTKIGVNSILLFDKFNLYKKKWKESLFLDTGNENVTLEAMYMDQDYTTEIITEEKINQLDIYRLPSSENFIYEFINQQGNNLLLVLGQPGSGKSSLITSTINKTYYENIIFEVFPLKNIENLNEIKNFNNIGEKIFEYSNIQFSDSIEYVVFFDGLDEILFEKSSDYINFINKLNQYVKITNKKIKIIISSRYNRFDQTQLGHIHFINLLPLSIEQICLEEENSIANKYINCSKKIIEGFTKKELELLKSNLLNVVGIPHIVYMIMAQKISLKESRSLVNVYNLLFSKEKNEHSVYWRAKYDEQRDINKEDIEFIHMFSKRVAINMWECNPEKAAIDEISLKIIVDNIYNEYKERKEYHLDSNEFRKVLIDQYFYFGQNDENSKKIELHFIHRTMYEYFLALSIYDLLCEISDCNSTIALLYQQNTNKLITKLFEIGKISYLDDDNNKEIKEFLYQLIEEGKINNKKDWLSLTDGFLKYGIFPFVDILKNNCVYWCKKNIITFFNIIIFVKKIIQATDKNIIHIKLFNNDVENENEYLKFYLVDKTLSAQKNLSELDFENFKLSSVDLSNQNLRRMNLVHTVLDDSNLQRSDLEFTKLDNSSLINVSLESADLKYASLEKAKLKNSILTNSNLNFANLKGVNMKNSNLFNATLKNSHLESAILKNTSLEKTIIENGKLKKAYICDSNFKNSFMYGANLSFSTIENSNFDGTNLIRANFQNAVLKNTILTNTNLVGAIFTNANLYKSDLSNANISGADFENACLEGVNFYNVKIEELMFIVDEENTLYESKRRDLSRGVNLKNADLSNSMFKKEYKDYILHRSEAKNIDKILWLD